MNIRRYLVSSAERRQYTKNFKFTDVNLLSCLVRKNGRFGFMISQITCQSNSQRRVNCLIIKMLNDNINLEVTDTFLVGLLGLIIWVTINPDNQRYKINKI